MQDSDRIAGSGYAFYSRPNRSLSRDQQTLVLLVVALPCLGIAAVFAVLGYWLMLPFAGLEVGLLVWAFARLREHDGDYESITICGDQLHLEWCDAGELHQRDLNTLWTRVESSCEAGGHCWFCLRSHGEVTELGRYLSDQGRVELAGELRTKMLPGPGFGNSHGQKIHNDVD